jgi:histidinol-phosphate aminotransferase
MKTSRFNINSLVRENVLRLKPYSSARDEFRGLTKDMIFLDANENPFENGVNRYPDPQQRNVKSILAEQNGVKQENILLGNGSDEVLDLIYRAFCEPARDNIITMPPTYGMYKVLADTNNIENKEVLLTEDFQLNIDAILASYDRYTKILFICSPNNPTGNVFNSNNIEVLLNSFKGLVVIDEAYIDFSSEPSWLKKLSIYPNLIVTQTLSKAYGLAGIRLGICYASTEIIAILNKIKPPYNVNELTQKRALKRLMNKKDFINEIALIIDEKNRLFKKLLQIKYIIKIYPTEANFILIKVDDASKRYDQLLDKGIVIRNRTSQPLCKNALRLTIGTPEENERLIKTLKELEL